MCAMWTVCECVRCGQCVNVYDVDSVNVCNVDSV